MVCSFCGGGVWWSLCVFLLILVVILEDYCCEGHAYEDDDDGGGYEYAYFDQATGSRVHVIKQRKECTIVYKDYGWVSWLPGICFFGIPLLLLILLPFLVTVDTSGSVGGGGGGGHNGGGYWEIYGRKRQGISKRMDGKSKEVQVEEDDDDGEGARKTREILDSISKLKNSILDSR